MSQRLSILLGILWCSIPICLTAADEGCPELKGKDAAARLEYLRGDRSKLAPACAVAAIKFVGGKHYVPASPILIHYLDYRDPSPMPQWAPIFEAYPAVDALDVIGKPAAPDLIAGIADAGASDVARRNATWALFGIYAGNQPEGIAVMVNAAHAQTDPFASIRLIDQAKWFAARCISTVRSECESAVWK